jgi:hypothetical protein
VKLYFISPSSSVNNNFSILIENEVNALLWSIVIVSHTISLLSDLSAVMTACSSNDNNKKIIWFYQFNPNSFDDKKKEEWRPYSDFETDYIEEAFNRNEENVQLNDYIIDLKNKIQFQKDKKDSGRSVKRELIDRKNYIRNERFSSNTERATPKSFIPGREWYKAPLLDEWRHKNETIRQNSSTVAELAAQGN